jgi:hypothetical protein
MFFSTTKFSTINNHAHFQPSEPFKFVEPSLPPCCASNASVPGIE